MNKTISGKNQVDDFYLAAREYCRFAETTQEKTKLEFLSGAQKLLSLVYLKASLLEKHDESLEEDAEKFVQEEDWSYIQNSVSNKIGSSDRFIDVVLANNADPDDLESENLSDCFADVYQDLKDFVLNYEIGNPDSLIAAIGNCSFNFEKYWGPRLLAILVNIHVSIYGYDTDEDEDFSENTGIQSNKKSGTDNWIINQRFNQ